MVVKIESKGVKRFLHVEIKPEIADAWRRFRDEMKVKRGPMEEQALVEFMHSFRQKRDKIRVANGKGKI